MKRKILIGFILLAFGVGVTDDGSVDSKEAKMGAASVCALGKMSAAANKDPEIERRSCEQ